MSIPTGRPMTRKEKIKSKLMYWRSVIRQYIPHIIFPGDELDVVVTIKTQKLDAISVEEALAQLNSGAFHEIEKIFRENGITFDKGMGWHGRDWEWDYSLQGPISISFKQKASKPERRLVKKKPTLRIVK